MATLRPDEVYSRIAAALQGLTTSSGPLFEAPGGYESVPDGLVKGQEHGAFGVQLISSTPEQLARARTGRPIRMVHRVQVVLTHRYRQRTAANVDAAAALQAESEAITAAVNATDAADLLVVYTGTTQRGLSLSGNVYVSRFELTATCLQTV